MAFSDLCHIGNAYKTVENETDQSERIMEENSIVRDLITNILDDGGPTDTSSSIPPPEKTLNGIQTNGLYPKNDIGNSYLPPSYNSYPLSNFNYSQNEQNGYNYNMQNGYGNTNGYANYPENDVNALLGMDLPDTTDTVTPEQLNLLRLAAQQIGGAQFQNPNKYDYNFFEPNQRNSLPETNMFPSNNFNRPNSLNLDMNYNNFDSFNNQRYSNNFKDSQDPAEILAYLTQLNMSLDRNQENGINNMDFKMPIDMNGHYQNDTKILEERNKYYNRSYQNQQNKNFDNNHFFDAMQMDRSPLNQNFDYSNQSKPNNYKTNGYNQNEFMQQRRDMNDAMMNQQLMHRDGFANEQRQNFDNNVGRDNMQQIALMRQNQELARQMSLLMRNRPPPNQLNVDVSFLHENNPYNLGLGALLGPSPPVPPPVLPSPMLDLPLLAPFYAMRNMRNAVTSSGILHARLDACYEQWRQLERERKRTEARLALAFPGRAVSSSNSIPVPRLPPCPSRVDRLTVDMLREHTKVLTLMGKMETLRASVCVAQNKKPNKPEENKITVLKRGQENVASDNKDGVDPTSFDPSSWRDDVKHLAEIAPHKEIETAMLNWRNAVSGVQSARKREMHPPQHPRTQANDPILQLAEAVKQLCVCARRARAAMWCDLTLTAALAPPALLPDSNQSTSHSTPTKQPAQENASNNAKPAVDEAKEEKPTTETQTTKPEVSTTTTTPATSSGANATKNATANKQTDKDKNHQQRRTQNYKKLNQRNDFYRNQRYDSRFMQNRHPYHYLATGPIN